MFIKQRLRDNWLTGNATTRFTTMSSDDIQKSADKLFWNSKFSQFSKDMIVGVGMNGKIQSWNRWTLEMEAVINIL